MSRGPLDGVLVVDKPAGPTSHDVVARVRRTSASRVGHTGTLDPLASGVLPLVLGRATRLARFLSGADKTYEAVVRLGLETDTYDSEGRPAAPAAGPLPDAGTVARAARAFLGEFEQVPPPYSAKKIGGTPAYKLARRDVAVALVPVRVALHAIEVLDQQDDRVRLRLTCSAGFYVRSLAHDLGAALGCGAHLAELRRTRAGDFGLDAAVPLDRLDSAQAIATALTPLDRLLPALPAACLSVLGAQRARHGQALGQDDVTLVSQAPQPQAGTWVRLVDPDGHLLGLARAGVPDGAGTTLHPAIVLV